MVASALCYCVCFIPALIPSPQYEITIEADECEAKVEVDSDSTENEEPINEEEEGQPKHAQLIEGTNEEEQIEERLQIINLLECRIILEKCDELFEKMKRARAINGNACASKRAKDEPEQPVKRRYANSSPIDVPSMDDSPIEDQPFEEPSPVLSVINLNSDEEIDDIIEISD